jgi:hypothetical protein
MSYTSDLVQSFKLHTIFHNDYIEHVYEDEDEERIERWHRNDRRLGDGGGSEAVWLETETCGRVRALKQIRSGPGLRGTLSRSRELLAMAKFKKVSEKQTL